jgi:hypothetical protein
LQLVLDPDDLSEVIRIHEGVTGVLHRSEERQSLIERVADLADGSGSSGSLITEQRGAQLLGRFSLHCRRHAAVEVRE